MPMQCLFNFAENFRYLLNTKLFLPNLKPNLHLIKICQIFQSCSKLDKEQFSCLQLSQIISRFSLIKATKQQNSRFSRKSIFHMSWLLARITQKPLNQISWILYQWKALTVYYNFCSDYDSSFIQILHEILASLQTVQKCIRSTNLAITWVL